MVTLLQGQNRSHFSEKWLFAIRSLIYWFDQWRIQDSPEGGANPPGGGATYYFAQFLPKTAWKWKNLDPEGGARASLAPPLDPPIYSGAILIFRLWNQWNKLILFILVFKNDWESECLHLCGKMNFQTQRK